MSAHDERRAQDIHKLNDLQKVSHDRFRVLRTSGTPVNTIEAELRLRTAPSTAYPGTIAEVTRFTVSLPARYPFEVPTITVTSPILHPNIFTSGRVCLGVKWIPSFGLDLLVRRLAQIVTFDPDVLNLASPANGAAVPWYQDARRRHPGSFPSDCFELAAAEKPRTMTWTNMSSLPSEKVTVTCPSCAAKLALPAGRSGNVTCPKCQHKFAVST